MSLDAIIFDVDGTLVDTNSAHVDAWESALKEHGYGVARDRIEIEIGKGGDQFIPALLGRQAFQRDGEALSKSHTEHFTAIATSRRLLAFPGVKELFAELRRRWRRNPGSFSSSS